MKKTITGATFMAVATGRVSKEVEVKRYMGVGAVGVVALNPTRKELNDIYGNQSDITDEIQYIGETTVKDAHGNDKKVPQIRLSFITKTDKEIACNNGIEAILPVNIFLSQGYSYSNKNNVIKVQVIDKYGRTGWVTEEELSKGAIPEYTIRSGARAGQTMKANLAPGYRPCFIGEEELVKFIIALLDIPRPDVWDNDAKAFVPRPANELPDCECMLENIKQYFSGNLKELRDVLNFQPNNRLKICFGVRTTQKGAQYQCAYTRFPMPLGTMRFTQLERELDNDAKAGRHPSEEYSTTFLEEVKLGATDYSKPKEEPKDADPFAAANTFVEEKLEDLPFGDPFNS